MMAGTARLSAKQPLKQRESSPAAGAKSKSQNAGKGGTRASVMSLIAKKTISKSKKTRDVSNEGVRADVTSEVPVVETMTWMRKLPVAETTTRKEPAPSLKSLADVLGITASVSEQLATEAICGGNVVSLSMAN